MRLAQALTAVYVLSLASIITGYYNTLLGLDIHAILWVLDDIPIFSASLVLTLWCPISTVLAFYFSRGNYREYGTGIFGINYLALFPIAFMLLPGESEKPDYLQFHMWILIVFLGIAQYVGVKILADEIWLYGGREIET